MKHIMRFLMFLIAAFQLNNVMAAENIAGTWQGTLVTSPGAGVSIQLIIERESDGSYSAILDSLDSNALKNIKADTVQYASGVLALDVPDVNGSYEGIVKDEKIEGKWKQEGTSFPLILSRYEKPTLSEEDMAKLLGTWEGKLNITGIDVTYVFRFKMSENGAFEGTLDLPDYGSSGTPVADIGICDGNLVFKIPENKTDYKGKLKNNEITGAIKSYGTTYPLTLNKVEDKSLVYRLTLPIEDTKLLFGKWSGKADDFNLTFRFERTKESDFVGFMDNPDEGIKGVAITEGKISDGQLTLKVAGVSGEFKGTLRDNKLDGEWTRGETKMQLSLTKEKP